MFENMNPGAPEVELLIHTQSNFTHNLQLISATSNDGGDAKTQKKKQKC